MGSWGYQIGDSDQALDVFETIIRNEIYLKAILNRDDVIYYLNHEEVLCAIAIIDAQFNGIDDRIWSNYITDDENYMSILRALPNWTPRYELIKTALYKLDLIKRTSQDGWVDENDKKERNKIIELLKERLQLVDQEVCDFLKNRNCKEKEQ